MSNAVHGILIAAVLLLTASCFLPAASAQTPEPADTLRIDTDLVNLNARVVSRANAPSLNLTQKDFGISEDGVPQEISFFASSDAPFDLVLLLDLSGSTSDKIGLIRKSARRFVDAARPADRIAIVTFADEIQVIAKLTVDHDELRKTIDNIAPPAGGTSFWDALRFVLEHIVSQSRAESRRSAVVVMTDGVDNALPEVYGDGSKTSFDELLKLVQRWDTSILPIYLDTEKETDRRGTLKAAYALARQQLALLAAESGNEVYQARKVKDLEGVYEKVIRDLSMVYSIGYRPAKRTRDGSWREVKIEVTGHPDLTVRAKRGYFAK